jgi:16S rRNA (cytosine967-C5)-methyltransferase
VTTRSLAVDALLRIEDGAYAHLALPAILERSDLAARDRAFVTELVYGTVRMQRALDYQLNRLSIKPVLELEPIVRAALRLGAYQLLQEMPAHAAVGETVEVVPQRARGYVNAVLRNLSRSGPPWKWPSGTDVPGIGVRTSHPDWIVQELLGALLERDVVATLAANATAPPVTLRVNRERGTPEGLMAELAELGATVARGSLVPDALVLTHSADVARAFINQGRATPQDQSSQAVVAALDPQPGERILDIAAAPGGKATAAAERMTDDGLVVAADLHPGRVRTIARAVARLQLASVACVVSDGRQLPVAPGSMDRVLLDAPCSGLGVLRRRADARWRVQPHAIPPLANMQRALLASAATAVRPGGRLVYSVCTLTSAETLGVDDFARAELPGFRALEPAGRPWRRHGRGALILPSDEGTDGMFVLVLERES